MRAGHWRIRNRSHGFFRRGPAWVSGWEVLSDFESLSDHAYLAFSFGAPRSSEFLASSSAPVEPEVDGRRATRRVSRRGVVAKGLRFGGRKRCLAHRQFGERKRELLRCGGDYEQIVNDSTLLGLKAEWRA